MKGNLQALQEEMRDRIQQQSRTISIPVKKPDGTVVIEERVLCSTPGCMRVRRKGKAYCSRCTQKGIEAELRDPLPETQVNWKTARNPNSNYIYVGVQEGQRARTGDEDILEVSNEIPKIETDDEAILSLDSSKSNQAVSSPVDNSTAAPVLEDKQTQTTLAIAGNEKYYSRKQAAQLVGTSSSSILRWEAKGAVPPPKKLVHSGQVVYTEEDITKLKEYLHSAVTYVPNLSTKSKSPRPKPESSTEEEQRNPGIFNLSVSKIKKLGKGNASGKRLNAVLSARLGRLV